MTAQELIDTIRETAQIGSNNKDIDLKTVGVVFAYTEYPSDEGPFHYELDIDKAKWDDKRQTVILNLEY
jgi:hypothetical protein